jgi:ankyrin repeat domain-containing protein 50
VVQLLVHSWAGDPRRLEAGPPSVSQVSREIDTFYGEIMTRIFHQASPDATLARLVLIWVAFSRRPLTVREITHVIGEEVLSGVIASCQEVLVDSDLFTTVCAGILTVDSETGTLHPAHVTLKEYLQRNREEIFAQSEEYITASCVEYLSLEDFKAGPCEFQFQRQP